MLVTGKLHAPATLTSWKGGSVRPSTGLDVSEDTEVSCPCITATLYSSCNALSLIMLRKLCITVIVMPAVTLSLSQTISKFHCRHECNCLPNKLHNLLGKTAAYKIPQFEHISLPT